MPTDIATSWDHLATSVASWLKDSQLGVFDQALLVVPTPTMGRLLKQALAQRMPTQIIAGVEIVAYSHWGRTLAEMAGCKLQWQQWEPHALQLPTADALAHLVHRDPHSALANYLTTERGVDGVRLRAHAAHASRLLGLYLAWAPQTLAKWQAGSEIDATGAPIPSHEAWQPMLFRDLVERTGVDPLALREQMLAALATADTSHWGIIQHGETPDLVAATRERAARTWQIDLSDARPATVEVHSTHHRGRQAEVVRDELTRCLAEHPDWEPRDCVILTPSLSRYAPALRAAFADAMVMDHPGRSLRVEVPRTAVAQSPIWNLLLTILRLPQTRATWRDLASLLAHPAISYRWRIDPARATELIHQAEIRWGIDEHHRAAFDLPHITQNTWWEGIDRMITGVATGQIPGLLPVAGLPTSNTDVALVGAMSEILSRLRQFWHQAQSPADIATWVERSQQLIDALCGLPAAQSWQLAQTCSDLATLAQHADPNPLGLDEFAIVAETASQSFAQRPVVGNGNLHVVTPGELPIGPHKVVVLLGFGQETARRMADLLPMNVPDAQASHTRDALSQCRSAECVIAVTRAFSTANEKMPIPARLAWLIDQLTDSCTRVTHPPARWDPTNFLQERPSFDRAAHSALTRTPPDASSGTLATWALGLPSPSGDDPLVAQDLVDFMANPARRFLKHHAMRSPKELPTTQIPVAVQPLDTWKIRNQMIEALLAGLPLESIADRIRREGWLPPGPAGSDKLSAAMTDAHSMWQRAEPLLCGTQRNLTVALPECCASIQTHQDQIVKIAPSVRGVKETLMAWVELVLASAQGITLEARVIKLKTVVSLRAPAPERARRILHILAHGARASRHRLIPLVIDPATRWLQDGPRQFLRSDNRANVWKSDQRREWGLFFQGSAAELLTLPIHPDDQQFVQGDIPGAFELWSRLLVQPYLEAL